MCCLKIIFFRKVNTQRELDYYPLKNCQFGCHLLIDEFILEHFQNTEGSLIIVIQTLRISAWLLFSNVVPLVPPTIHRSTLTPSHGTQHGWDDVSMIFWPNWS